ncbi:BZIP domain-containing protein [Aphelenchoides bicaudatus]|nr:BZIP domain-containing protein [Aphelenchoides bicaudatus]
MVEERRRDSNRRAVNGRRSESALPTRSPASSQNNNSQVCLGRPQTPFTLFPNTSAVQSPNSFASRKQKSKRVNQARNDSLWFLFLILSSLSPDKQLFYPGHRNLDMDTKNVRTLFDPMIGEFCADTSPQLLDKFFGSKMRFRDDTSMYMQHEPQINMMMTEQPPAMLMRNSNLAQPSGTNTSNHATDPSILDYDAIDVFWRQDIEREKGIAPVYPLNYVGSNSGQGCSTSQMCDVSEQYERDLQLLREKSLFTGLTNEENFRYENLSKAHYVDFYRTVPPAAAKRWQSASAANSTSDYSNNTDQFPRPMSPAKSNISSFDENEAASFFSNLAKQSMMEENRQQRQMQAPQQLPTYSNLTLCTDQSGVLNNVSLAQQANLPGVYANDTFFMTNPTGNGIRGSAAQQEPTLADDILNGIADQPLEISETEATALWSNMQNSDVLNDAVQLQEFVAMEILGEFQQPNMTTINRTDSPIPENVLTYVERETSPSSGIGSMQSSSSSPNHNNEDFGYGEENEDQSYRFYDKLAPKVRNHRASFSTDASADSFRRPQSAYQRKQSKIRGAALAEKQNGAQRKRGRQSKDEQLAMDHNLPASAEEFASMTHIEIQKYMRDPKLSALQKSLIKKIRRRGRNKIAARKCRGRRENRPQDEFYIKDELQSNYDPNDMSMYEF